MLIAGEAPEPPRQRRGAPDQLLRQRLVPDLFGAEVAAPAGYLSVGEVRLVM